MSNDRVDELREIVRANRPETPDLSTAIHAAVDRQASVLRAHREPDSASVTGPTGSEEPMPITDTAEGPAYTAEAYAAVEKAAKSLRSLYAPSVLEHAAGLLTDLWAAGERHGVPASEWGWAVDLPGGALEVVASRYARPEQQRTIEEVRSLARHLLEALASDEIGLRATYGTSASIIIERGPHTPRGGFHGDASVVVGIYTDGGWYVAFNQDGAPVLSIAAPASQAGASQVAEIVRALVRGELGNPFRR